MVHSGLMEIPDRDPTAFFEAIAQMRKQGDIANDALHVTLRATGRDDDYRRQIAELAYRRHCHHRGTNFTCGSP